MLLNYLRSGRPWLRDLVVVPLPENTSFVMARVGGRDQGLEQVLRDGWTSFESPLPYLFRAAVMRCGGTILDVGANTGFYSLLAARAPGRRKIMAWEPMPEVRGVLRRNIAANGLRGVVTVLDSAVGDCAGRASLFVPDPRHGLLETSASLNPAFKSFTTAIEVVVMPIDSLLSHQDRIGVIKIDVEGHEAAVLRGALGLIARDRPILFVEVLPGANVGFMTQLLMDLSYVDVPLSPDGQWAIAKVVCSVPDAWNHAFVPSEVCEELFRRRLSVTP